MIKDNPKIYDDVSQTSFNVQEQSFQEQSFQESYRCSTHLKAALQRSEQLLNKAEKLQKELSNRFYSTN